VKTVKEKFWGVGMLSGFVGLKRDFLKDKGIATGIHYPVPCHKQPAVEHLSAPALERTERIVTEILTLPISAGHTEAEVDEVVAAVRQFFGG